LRRHEKVLYAQLAKYYDRIYWWKDYEREVKFLLKLFRLSDVRGKEILDVACGTGNHAKVLQEKGYKVTGMDISEDVLKIARRKVRDATFLSGNMRELDKALAGRGEEDEYNIVLCMFSAISYNLAISDLKKTLQGFYDHLKEGGIVVFDTHFTDAGFIDGYRGEDIFDDGRVIGARLSTSKRDGGIGQISFTYLIKDGAKVIVLRNDVHKLGLFDAKEILRTMREVGFVGAKIYTDWSVGKKPVAEGKTSDTIFVGLRQTAQ
jgi:SAM-dependent methyltransferase